MMSVLYEELAPKEFLERIQACPVGYLPLGTIEWHGLHNPLGVDLLESKELFLRAAERFGGIVFPPLFLGPDRRVEKDGKEYLGMDVYFDLLRCPPYPLQQMPGSCYWVPTETYRLILESIFRQAQRAGFKVLVGVGHGPSTDEYYSMADLAREKYGLTLLTPSCDGFSPRLINDHAAQSETSAMMYFRPELVHLDRLDPDPDVFPLGVSGPDPRTTARPEYTESILEDVLNHLGELIRKALA